MDVTGAAPLPKGIFTNTNSVYQEVASYSILPADKIHRYWHVYTVTNKKLQDPTARRLENFWWHVWGSDRSRLSGRVLAKLFEDISLGPTIVPLRGPANRWEGPDVPPMTIQTILAHLRSNTLLNSQASHASVQIQQPTTATSPPVSHLKKAGSSSTDVSRDTDHSLSPSQSIDEDGSGSETPSSGSTLAYGVDVSAQDMANSPAQLLGRAATQALQSPTTTLKTSANSPPSSSPKAVKLTYPNRVTIPDLQQTRKVQSPIESSREQIVLEKQPMRCSQSNAAPEHPREPPAYRPNHSLFTDAILSTTKVDAQGTILDQAGSLRTLPPPSTMFPINRDGESSCGGSSTCSLLHNRLAPTQPSSSMILPLGRTKSQLTLLLEREKGRSRTS